MLHSANYTCPGTQEVIRVDQGIAGDTRAGYRNRVLFLMLMFWRGAELQILSHDVYDIVYLSVNSQLDHMTCDFRKSQVILSRPEKCQVINPK